MYRNRHDPRVHHPLFQPNEDVYEDQIDSSVLALGHYASMRVLANMESYRLFLKRNNLAPLSPFTDRYTSLIARFKV